MKRIELRAADGDFVAVVEIMPFPTGNGPEVVMWGSRVFVKDHCFDDTYAECFVAMSLTPPPGLGCDEP